MQKMEAIKLALGRLDGKIKTPVRIEYPKIYYLYPNAKPNEDDNWEGATSVDVFTSPKALVEAGEIIEHKNDSKAEPEPTLQDLTLRQTLAKMSDYPREVPDAVIHYAEQTQQWLQGNAPEPEEKPAVKSVVAAHLLALAQKRNIEALSEVFDQIDGKLTEVIQILGEDIYITSYSLTAPAGAYLNADGVLQLEATQAQDLWAQKLKDK
jgi:hypothetical protein